LIRAYVALGSNLDAPRAQVRRALAELSELPGTTLVAQSSLYRTPPMGPQDQPPYINAVAALDTNLSAINLLKALLGIERAHGRVRGGERWGPRTLDLDVLLYGDQQIDDASLTVPHPGIADRAFVLYPLSEIAPGIVIPGKGALPALLASCPPEGIERMAVDG
jgi:2-amino-4-hydroxy-6-hydroxymethyldihydropteridine diphosphokinase